MFGGQVEVESAGCWLRTSDGRRFLNVGGYGVFLMGARHPTVVAAVQRQLHTHPTASRLFLEPRVALAAEALLGVCPPGLERVHFSGSGAEAVEAAIKMARTHGRRRLISMENGYHGKTLGALSVTAREVFQAPFRPLLPDVTHVPFGDVTALAAVLAYLGEEACVLAEPVQGEAGVIIPPEGYLRDVAALCRAHGAFFVLDEVQTGLGRLGSWWGADREGVTPDVLLAGKGLSGGVVPVAATIATSQAFGVFDRDPFLHTSTFSGSPLAMAAVTGAIQAITEDDLVRRSAALGDRLLPELDRIVRAHLGDLVSAVRGVGLLIGVEFAEPGVAGELLIELVQHGVIANHSLNAGSVLRLTPPALLTDSDLEFLLDAVDRASASTARCYPAALRGPAHA
ncbi:MAG: aspartate aminotransferase family protein [Actinobacteria bacterium]|nr:aspartate aminotransferase family protein [Actinomycetota bacterium]MBI3688540.1 aspartate aminotransferase family protein [Actinomycetota bacterium]